MIIGEEQLIEINTQNKNQNRVLHLSTGMIKDAEIGYESINSDMVLDEDENNQNDIDSCAIVGIRKPYISAGRKSMNEITYTEKNLEGMIPIFKKEFGEKEIRIIRKTSIQDAYENNFQKIKEMANGKILYIYEENIQESHKLLQAIYTTRDVLLEHQSNKNSVERAREQKIKQTKTYTLENGKNLVMLRFNENKKVSFAKMADILNKKKEPTPSGKGRWAAGNVERTYKRYLKLNEIKEKDIQVKFNPIKSDCF